MLTKSDLKWLKENLATKDDVKNFATKDDLKGLATKSDLKKLDQKLDKKFTKLFDFLDKDVMDTKRKVKVIEQYLHIPSVS